jgi:hypothetical protein
MSSWTIRYSAESNGLKLQEIRVSNEHPKIEEITINTDSSCKLLVAEISFKDGCTQEEAIEIGDNLINIFFDQLSIEYDISIGTTERFLRKNTAKQTGNYGEVVIQPFLISGYGSSIYTPSEEQLNTIKDSLEKARWERNINLQLYRSCIAQKDSVSRFMFLYNLLSVIADDDQKIADEIITKYEPEVEKKESPRKKRNGEAIQETIYTRLRNEIAHKRAGSFPEKTRNEINSYVNKFQRIVKQAVLEKICPEHH